MTTPWYKTPPPPGFFKIHNLGRPFLAHDYFILSLIYVWERKIHGHTIAQERLLQGVMKYPILVYPSLLIITVYSVCLICAQQ